MKLRHYKDIIFSSSLIAPLAFLAVYFIILAIIKGSLPPAEAIIDHLESLYGRYGYEIVFLGAFLEGALIIDLFVPGASIVLFGAILSRSGVIEFPIYLIFAFLGFTLGFLFDYCLGYFGWSGILIKLGLGKELEKAKKKILKFGGKAFFLGYFHPDVASIFVTAAGIVRLNFKEFMLYNFLAGFFWLIFWSGLAYLAGEGLILVLRKYFLLTVLGGVAVWILINWFLKRK